MSDTSRQDVTYLLDAIGAGDPTAASNLLPVVYDELRRLARAQLSSEPKGLTLQATALVHEAYLRLVGNSDIKWENRGHFFSAAARAMRRILVERARRVRAVKHGGGQSRGDLHENIQIAETTPTPDVAPVDLLSLHAALDRLEARDARQAEIVMLRYFAGLSIEETALAMNLSASTIKNEWTYARAWLRREVDSAREQSAQE